MIWPAMLFNLCVGLLLAGYLLRAVRRFERRADAIMVKLDQAHESRLARLNEAYDSELRKYDTARDEIKASMRAQVDRMIAKIEAELGPSAGRVIEVHTLDTLKVTQISEARPASAPTEEEIRALPCWARMAFAARCARRVLPLVKHFWRDAPQRHLLALDRAVRTAANTAITAATAATAANTTPAPVATTVIANTTAATTVIAANTTITIRAVHPAYVAAYPAYIAAAAAEAYDARAAYAAYAAYVAASAADIATYAVDTAVFTHAAYKAVDAAVFAARADADQSIRRDFEMILGLAQAKNWLDDTPIPPSVFGPLWPESPPEGWPKPEHPATQLSFTFDVPDDMTTAEAIELAKELSTVLCELHLAGRGHGLAIQPLEITTPARAGVPV